MYFVMNVTLEKVLLNIELTRSLLVSASDVPKVYFES